MSEARVCAKCGGDMAVVHVKHLRGNTTVHQVCPVCITSRTKSAEPVAARPLAIVREASA